MQLGNSRVLLDNVGFADSAAEAPITCTFTNEKLTGTLVVRKVVDNSAGGAAVATNFAFNVAGPDAQGPVPFSQDGADPELGRNTLIVTPGTYSVTENAPIVPGYTVSYDNCSNVSVQAGQTETCTITNTAQQATLTLIKTVENGETGAQLGPNDFGLTIDGQPVDSGQALDVAPGAHLAAEIEQAGYTASDWGGDCDADGNVTVALGENAVCTITNTAQQATLTLIKTVENGETGAQLGPNDFGLTIDGQPVDSGQALNVAPGAHLAAEIEQAGYTASDWGGDCDADGNVTVALGENAVCTITNTAQQATLTLIKTVENGETGAQLGPNDFGLTIDGQPVDSGQALDVAPGAHLAAEIEQAGYTASDWGGDCDADGNVTVALGENAVCTITNTAQQATLTLIKTVENGETGAQLGPNDFGLTIDGQPVDSGQALNVAPGAHLAAEIEQAGYTASDWGGDCDADGNVTVALGENAVCTITNTAQQATLTLIKTVENGETGAQLGPNDFGLTIDGQPVDSGQALDVAPGAHLAAEIEQAGYTASDWGGDCDADGNVTVALGENAVCTITNTAQQATLTLIKTVENGETGAQLGPNDFGLTIDGQPVDSGQALDVAPGAHLAAEIEQAGYTASDWGGDCDADGNVTVALGENAVCTITNTAQQATITLNKVVQGGPAQITDFQAQLDGNDVDWGVAVPVVVGPHTASEIMNVDDYVAGDWTLDCAADGTVTAALGDQLECTISNFYAELSVEKSADPAFYSEVGDVISYTITATNTGLATLDGVDVTDEFPGGLDDFTCRLNGAGDPVALPYDGLAPGDAIECTASYTIVEADITAGSVFNQACADADQVSDEVCDDATVRLSELEIVKTADVDFYDAVGDVINYTIIATNTGETDLTDVDITDNLIADLDGWECRLNGTGDPITLPLETLAAGDTIECSASYTIVEADITAGSVFNQACADSLQTNEVCDDVDTPLARLEIVKSASPDTYSAVGDEIVYTVTATNTGEATLENVDISDALIDGLPSWTCQVGDSAVALPVDELLSGQSIECTATYAVTEDDVAGSEPEGSVTNVACAISDQTPEVCDEVTANEIVIELIKTVTPTVLAEPGGIFTYTLTIDNESVVPVTITELVDDNSGLSTDWATECQTLIGSVLGPDAPGTARRGLLHLHRRAHRGGGLPQRRADRGGGRQRSCGTGPGRRLSDGPSLRARDRQDRGR